MYEYGASQFLDVPDMVLGQPILVVCIHPGIGQWLIAVFACIDPFVCAEYAVVGVVCPDGDAV